MDTTALRQEAAHFCDQVEVELAFGGRATAQLRRALEGNHTPPCGCVAVGDAVGQLRALQLRLSAALDRFDGAVDDLDRPRGVDR